MARRRTPPGCKPVSVDLPIDLDKRVHALADRNRRAYRDEVIHALERHLAVPPVVRIITPETPPSEVEHAPKKRGRPPTRKKEEPG